MLQKKLLCPISHSWNKTKTNNDDDNVIVVFIMDTLYERKKLTVYLTSIKETVSILDLLKENFSKFGWQKE